MTSGTFRLTAGIVSACLAALALGGCPALEQFLQGEGELVTDKGFVGRMQEADALIGIVMEDGEVLAYVCDAVEGGESRSGWYEGLLIDGVIEMTPVIGTTYEGTSFGSKITATLSDDVIEGVLELEDGTQFPFTAELASSETAAGLYVDGTKRMIRSSAWSSATTRKSKASRAFAAPAGPAASCPADGCRAAGALTSI